MLGVSPGIELAILSLCTIDPPANYVTDLLTAAELYSVDPLLVAAVVSVETRCDAEAIGGAGEIGLMQIHPYTWRTQEYNADRLLDATGLVWADGYQLQRVFHIELVLMAHPFTEHDDLLDDDYASPVRLNH